MKSLHKVSYTKWLNRGLTGLLVEYRFALQSTNKSSELQTFLFKVQTFDEGGDQEKQRQKEKPNDGNRFDASLDASLVNNETPSWSL